MNEQEFAELSAAAALHALPADDERRLRDALRAHPEWQHEVEADAEAAAALGFAVAPEAPPAGIRAALLAQIAEPAPAQQVEPPNAAPARPRRGVRMLFALAASVALLVGVGYGVASVSAYLNRPAAVIALDDIRAAGDAEQATIALDDGGTATAHWSASLGTAVLVTDGIAQPAADEDYELWFVRGDTPVPAGVFAVEDGKATAVLEGEMHAGDVIAVTVEQAGGSPTGLPTSDPIIVIPTA